jgi:hypothetical protein
MYGRALAVARGLRTFVDDIGVRFCSIVVFVLRIRWSIFDRVWALDFLRFRLFPADILLLIVGSCRIPCRLRRLTLLCFLGRKVEMRCARRLHRCVAGRYEQWRRRGAGGGAGARRSRRWTRRYEKVGQRQPVEMGTAVVQAQRYEDERHRGQQEEEPTSLHRAVMFRCRRALSWEVPMREVLV